MHTAMMSLQLPEPPTVSTAANLVVSMISLVDSLEPLQQLMMGRGKEMVEVVIKAIGAEAPRSHLIHFTNILFALCGQCVSQLSQWLEVTPFPFILHSTHLCHNLLLFLLLLLLLLCLQEVLAQDKFPSVHVSVMEKQQFRHAILRYESLKPYHSSSTSTSLALPTLPPPPLLLSPSHLLLPHFTLPPPQPLPPSLSLLYFTLPPHHLLLHLKGEGKQASNEDQGAGVLSHVSRFPRHAVCGSNILVQV